jgi:hypothetical protein
MTDPHMVSRASQKKGYCDETTVESTVMTDHMARFNQPPQTDLKIDKWRCQFSEEGTKAILIHFTATTS